MSAGHKYMGSTRCSGIVSRVSDLIGMGGLCVFDSGGEWIRGLALQMRWEQGKCWTCVSVWIVEIGWGLGTGSGMVLCLCSLCR